MATYSIGKFSKEVGKSIATLRRWDQQGILKAGRTLTGHRYYTDQDAEKVLGRAKEQRDE